MDGGVHATAITHSSANCGDRRGRVVRAWDTLIMFEASYGMRKVMSSNPSRPRRVIYSRMSFSSDQVTGTVFSHLNMPFLPNSKFI